MRCVVFGASGYIGGQLVPALLAAGHEVRAVARSADALAEAPWRDQVEVLRGDVTRAEDVQAAVAGTEVAYYLVHSLARRDFERADRHAAQVMADAAGAAGLQRLVYLGGIVPDEAELSAHLASRAEVGRILLGSGVPTAVLQAAVIVGSGSVSFEILRHVTERFPALITPAWVHNRVQPIAIRDVLHYLVCAAELPGEVHGAFDIGGPDVLSYLGMMRRYAVLAGLYRRAVLPLPALAPGPLRPLLPVAWAAAQGLDLLTPVSGDVARPLIESLEHEVVCHDREIAAHIPEPEGGLCHYEQSVELALHGEPAIAQAPKAAQAPRGQSTSGQQPRRGAGSASAASARASQASRAPLWAEATVYSDVRERATGVSPQALWEAIESIGGELGWYSFPLAWSARGWVGALTGVGGPDGAHRESPRLHPGEVLEWWRVEHLERPRLLRLRAVVPLPGRAWLELGVEPGAGGGAVYRQRAVFEPHGLGGHLYWQTVAPLRDVVFGGMARTITSAVAAPGGAASGAC